MKSEITNHNSKIRISLLSVLVIWIILAPLLAKWLVVEKQIEHPDAILVLAGGSAIRERTRIAAGLFEQGAAPRVLLTNDGEQSGWYQSEQRNPFNFERAKRELTAAGVPEAAIDVFPGVVGSTRDEAIAVKDLSGDLRFKRILIVTSAHHTRRALRVFEITASEIEFGITSAPAESVWFWWLSPKGWRDIGIEYVKLGYYWVSY
ncbi:MAG: YdcF family protein [Acidobacteria bacterium]|nr:YdcF family protein [Acidobacteriota bacterium]